MGAPVSLTSGVIIAQDGLSVGLCFSNGAPTRESRIPALQARLGMMLKALPYRAYVCGFQFFSFQNSFSSLTTSRITLHLAKQNVRSHVTFEKRSFLFKIKDNGLNNDNDETTLPNRTPKIGPNSL